GLLQMFGRGGLPRLETLRLGGNITWGHLRLLQLRVKRPMLAELDLSDGAATREDVQTLAKWVGASSLRRLNLRNTRIQVGGAVSIADSTSLKNLEMLDVSYSAVGVSGTRALVESPNLIALHTLGLRGNDFGLNGLRALIGSPHRQALRRL